MGILAAAAFVVFSTYHMKKVKSPGQLVFGWYIILPINHVADSRDICQRKQTQIDNDVNQENSNRIDHDLKVGDQVMTQTMSAYIYKTPYGCTYKIVQTWKSGTVTLIIGAVTMRINIRNINPYNTPNVQGRDTT